MHVRVRTVCFLVVVWLGGASAADGQVPRQAAADSVGRALHALTARLDSIEAGTCPSGPAITPPALTGEPRTDSLVATIEALSRRLETIRAGRCAPPAAGPAAPSAAADTSGDLAALRAAAAQAADTDPINGIIIARNILTGLRRVSPENAAYFTQREQDFERRVLEATIGADLVNVLTAPVAYDLLKSDKLYDFLGQKQYQGKPLLDRLGGWMKESQVFRGKEIACYHKEWAYFSNRYKVTCAEYIEAKPGIPPTPGHVQEVIALMKERKILVLFASNYFDRNQIRLVAQRTGAQPVIVPENTQGAPGVNTYFDLMNAWVNGLAAAFKGGAS